MHVTIKRTVLSSTRSRVRVDVTASAGDDCLFAASVTMDKPNGSEQWDAPRIAMPSFNVAVGRMPFLLETIRQAERTALAMAIYGGLPDMSGFQIGGKIGNDSYAMSGAFQAAAITA